MRKTTLTAVLAALLVLPAAGQHVHTPRPDARVLPLPKARDVWHFVVFGDRTGGPPEGIEVLAQAVRDTNLLDPDLVMTVGDLIQGYNLPPEWMTQMKEYRRTMAGLGMPWYPVAGNHDVYWRGPGRPRGAHEEHYETHFGPLYYWFRHKNAAFVVLYSDEGDPETGEKGFRRPRHTQMSKEQLGWLARTLKKARDAEHVFCFLHHPRWIEHNYPGSNWDDVHRVLAAAGNVTAVFAGHIHRMHYAGRRDGIEYVALATTGGHIPDPPVPGAGWLHHMNVVTVRKPGISIATLPVGAVMDPREMTPERLDDIDRLLAMRPSRTGEPIVLAADGSAEGSCELELENPCRRPVEMTLTPAALAAGLTFVPDHAHLRLAPGERRRVSLACRRPGIGFDVPFPMPALLVQLEWLGPTTRVAVPERRWPVPLTLSPQVAGLPARAEGALTLPGGGACARVAARHVKVPQGAFTLEGWVNAERFKRRQPFLAKSENSEFCIFVNEGRPSFSVHLEGRYVEAKAGGRLLETGRWHHVAGVFDGRDVRLYVDGRLAASRPGKGRRTTNRHPLYVGADPDRHGRPVDHLEGLVDEVRLSTKARYTGDGFRPPRRCDPDDHTLLLLHLDRDLGPFVLDASGHGHHAERLPPATCTPLPDQR